MASLNTSTNGPSIKSSYQGVIDSSFGPAFNSPTFGLWALFSVSTPLVNAFQPDRGGKESILKVQCTGDGELSDLIDEFSEGRIQFAFVKIKDSNTGLPKYVLIGWCGEGVPERTKGYFTSHLAVAAKLFHGYHVQITARSDRDLTPESIVKKVADASGAKYSADNISVSSSRPVVAPSKPVYSPPQFTGQGGVSQLSNSRARTSLNNSGVDDDGWGTDAPQVTRSQLEKVPPAYKPTKVNMAELTKQKSATTQINGNPRQFDNGDVVKGGYQPVGKVDIAAIRAQAQNNSDDRPTIVKGAYEPVGKVDIAAIRAKAQKPSNNLNISTSTSAADNSDDSHNKTVENWSTKFSDSERLTALPKPKVANKFNQVTPNFTGTKPPQPGGFGSQFVPATFVPPSVGTVSKTFADEGGKTPAQLWQEKKARERSSSRASTVTSSNTAQNTGQKSVDGKWKSSYTGKSWTPVTTNPTGRSGAGSVGYQRTGEQEQAQEQEQEHEKESHISSSGGISALRSQFQGVAPVKAHAVPQSPTSERSPLPPPIQISTRPTDRIPPAPPQVRSPTPDSPQRESSPIRIAMPVARSKEIDHNTSEEVESTDMGNKNDIHEHNYAEPVSSTVDIESDNHSPPNLGSPTYGKCALIQYDYEIAEDNEIQLIEGEYVTDIDMVDDDWWMGSNSRGERGLFPSNYVELVDEDL